MRILALGLMAVPLAACATTPAPDAPADQPPPMAGACNADAAQSHVGSTVTAAIGATIQKESGARSLRWGPPNSAWTMDYREDRVNVRYDDEMKIAEITRSSRLLSSKRFSKYAGSVSESLARCE